MIQFGLRLHDAEKLPVEQVLPLVRQKGFTCAHVALSKSFKELPCTPSALTPGYALYLRHLFEKNGIDIAVLGNYLNQMCIRDRSVGVPCGRRCPDQGHEEGQRKPAYRTGTVQGYGVLCTVQL